MSVPIPFALAPTPLHRTATAGVRLAVVAFCTAMLLACGSDNTAATTSADAAAPASTDAATPPPSATATPSSGDGCAEVYCADDAVCQAVPLKALTSALLEGPIPFSALLAHGDTGLGGMSPIDGEAVIVDGKVFHARLDGSLRAVAPTETLSVAFVKRFRADRMLMIGEASGIDAFQKTLDDALIHNRFNTIRIDGRFARLKLRSVPRQQPPYRSVTEVVKEQQELELRDAEGTLVGFRFPSYLSGVNSAGYHFHFVDHARKQGGHLLDIDVRGVQAQIDSSRALTLMVPDDAAFDAHDFGSDDPSQAAFDNALRPGRAPASSPRDE